MANSEIRIGKVSSVAYEKGMARVTYRDKDDSTTMEFSMMNYNDEYRMPEPGQDIVVAHLSNGSSRGVILGTIWNNKNIPSETGKLLYRKDLSKKKDAAYIRYDDDSGEYLVKAANMHLNGVNKTILDGPEVEIAANISIFLQTENMGVDIQKLSVTGGEAGELNIGVKADIAIEQSENQLKAVISKVLLELVENLEIKAGTGIKIDTDENVKIQAGTNIELSSDGELRLKNGKYDVTLTEIMERLGVREK